MEHGVIIRFGEYRIRTIRPTDESALAEHANNREISRFVRDVFPYPYTIDDARAFIADASSKVPPLDYAIASDTGIIGCIGLTPQTDIHRFSAEIGYWLAQPFHGRGIMSRAVSLFSQFVFDHRPIIRLFAAVFSNNPASMRVLEKAGFTMEGIMKSGAVKDEQILDVHLYAKIK